ncbi:MAG: efflux RND transporter permease subunit, partial [Bacilli bacterium]
MNFLTKFSLKNSIAVFIISFLVILAGTFSFQKLKVELLPNIEFPVLTIQAVYPGASPDDVKELVTDDLESALKGIEGVKSMSSSSYESFAVISLELPFEADMDKVEQQANAILKETKLPETVSTEISRFSFGAFPIYNISLFAENNPSFESFVNETLIPELNKIPGINSVGVSGVREEIL